MSLRKQTQEANRTRRHLGSWLDRHPDGPEHYSSTLYPMVEQIAEELELPASVVGDILTTPPVSTQVCAFLYEESLLRPWGVGTGRPIDDFITKMARREKPLGRKYLTALAQSTMEVWEVVDVDPGSSVSVRLLRKEPLTGNKIRRVHDVLASESLFASDALLGRVLRMPEGRIFAASILPINRHEALALPRATKHRMVQAGFAAWGVELLRELIGVADLGYEHRGAPTAQSQRSTTSDSKTFDKQAAASGRAASAEAERQVDAQREAEAQRTKADESAQSNQHANRESVQPRGQALAPEREKLLGRIRKLFAMSQETEASPHEAEIALRRCQSLMARYGISESDLYTSKFTTEAFRAGHRMPMHIKWLATAVEALHSVLFVTGCGEPPEFRGFDIDVKVARLTMEYLEDAIERSLATRRRTGEFPPGRSAAYDYRVAFAMEVNGQVQALVNERKAAEAVATVTGTSLTDKKLEIVQRECAHDLVSSRNSYNGARPGDAADAGRADGARVSIDPQMSAAQRAGIEHA